MHCGDKSVNRISSFHSQIYGVPLLQSDQIYEFDYVLRRFNQLKEEIFGVDYITDLMDSESEVKYLNSIG